MTRKERMEADKKNSCSVAWSKKPLKATIHLPSSKSISTRLLMMEALSGKKFPLKNISEADDTKLLQQLLSSDNNTLDAQNAGTCFRFLTAYLSLKEGEWILTGSERMKERPIGELVDALRMMGAAINYLEKENFPSLSIHGKRLNGKEIQIDASQSSQFVSALLLIAPYVEGGLKLKMVGEISSEPYIEMTLKLMEQFGIKILRNGNSIEIEQQEYVAKEFSVEPDWSSAAFWYAMAALSDAAEIFLEGLSAESMQGDSIVAELMKSFAVQTKFTKEGAVITRLGKSIQKNFSFNFSGHPDLAPAFFVLCSALGVEAKFTGIKNLSIKESNRAEALKTELEKCGAKISRINEDEYRITSTINNSINQPFNNYNDHRLAMAFAMLAIPLGKVEIKNPAVVSKSYPGFWNDLRSAGFEVQFV
ncbi:MAG TPA: 3-phosphoshikimate 1-carboxyvinyltransferase [Bacteroidia bacterium]|nr:3-phosphoshikimate 1-carboxyvinyltransferase [Bacteroidia bacterium]